MENQLRHLVYNYLLQYRFESLYLNYYYNSISSNVVSTCRNGNIFMIPCVSVGMFCRPMCDMHVIARGRGERSLVQGLVRRDGGQRGRTDQATTGRRSGHGRWRPG